MKYLTGLILGLFTIILTTGSASAWVATPSLKPTVDAVWKKNWNAYNTVVANNYTNWHIGTNLAQDRAAQTNWTCFIFIGCYFDVTVRPEYVTPQVIAHEGGHILCVSWWQEPSELCADSMANWILSQ